MIWKFFRRHKEASIINRQADVKNIGELKAKVQTLTDALIGRIRKLTVSKLLSNSKKKREVMVRLNQNIPFKRVLNICAP